MIITKTIFKTTIDIKPEELRNLRDWCLPEQYVGLMVWIKKQFGLDLLSKINPL